MRVYKVLVKKEWLEACRSYRVLWMPAFFLLLGVMQPLSMYYMEDLLAALGGLPEGAVLAFPEMSEREIYLDTIAQFSQIGLLGVVIGYMGVFANERKTGEAMLVLAKPVSYSVYWLSKWSVAVIIVLASYAIGLAGAVYYIQLLFGALPLSTVLASGLVYGLWLVVILTITLTIGTFVKSPAMTAISSIFVAFALMFLPVLLGEGARFTPGGLLPVFEQLVYDRTMIGFVSIYVSIFVIVLSLITSIFYMKKSDWAV